MRCRNACRPRLEMSQSSIMMRPEVSLSAESRYNLLGKSEQGDGDGRLSSSGSSNNSYLFAGMDMQ